MAQESRHQTPQRKKSTVTPKDRARNRAILRVLGFFLAVVVAFALGFVVRSQTAFIASLGFNLAQDEDASGASSSTKSVYDSLSARIDEVEDLLSQNSFDDYDLQSATDSLMEALIASTEDAYAAYFNAERYSSYIQETLEGSYAGIGVLFTDYNGHACVVDVFEGSEAEAKGVTQGDYIISIDGDDSFEWSMTEVVNALAREEGSEVVITWMHPSTVDAETGEEYSTTLVCRTYEEANVTTSLDDDGVGYIKLRQITQNSASLVQEALEDLTAEGATSFVLDLRDNPGGYLTQAVDIASLFVSSGVLVQIDGVEGPTTKTASGATLTEAALVVLVNEYTSSAAEVLAAALQDNQRAEIVGKTTMGKGSVQVLRELSFGGAIRYTAAYYLTPLGYDIDGVGIVPDISVSSGDDDEDDVALSVALDVVQSL